MYIQRLGFEKYKSFEGETAVEIAPLTILVGANNSGKTALAKAIHLLSSNVAPPDGDSVGPLLLHSGGVRHGRTFDDLVTKRFAYGILSLSIVLGDDSNELSLSVKVQDIVNRYKLSESKQQISYWGLSCSGCRFEAKKEVSENFDEKIPYKIYDSEASQKGGEQQIGWRGLLPRRPGQFPGWVNEQIDVIRKWASGVRYLKCPRDFPSLALARGAFSPSEHDAKGGTASLMLAEDDDLRDSVREWYEQVLGASLNIRWQGDYFDLIIRSKHRGAKVLLEQSGEGLSQVLPVVITALTSDQMGAGVDIIEHPESGLHPAVHADVAELLLNNLKGSTRPVIIETHSEMMLLRTRRWIASGKLPADHVIVYWVYTKPGRGSVLQKITINDKGEMSSWPEGVFIEDYEEVLAIQRAVAG